MAYYCHSCGTELAIAKSSSTSPVGSSISRSDTCSKCMSDVRACKNCTHYDPKIYNECRETQAERIVDKEKSNYCDYFSLMSDNKGSNKDGTMGSPKSDALSALDDLFKK